MVFIIVLLLQFMLSDHEEAQIRLSKVAAPILLQKAKDVIAEYVKDKQLNGRIPLSRYYPHSFRFY